MRMMGAQKQNSCVGGRSKGMKYPWASSNYFFYYFYAINFSINFLGRNFLYCLLHKNIK
jgi:hypothetical protein